MKTKMSYKEAYIYGLVDVHFLINGRVRSSHVVHKGENLYSKSMNRISRFQHLYTEGKFSVLHGWDKVVIYKNEAWVAVWDNEKQRYFLSHLAEESDNSELETGDFMYRHWWKDAPLWKEEGC